MTTFVPPSSEVIDFLAACGVERERLTEVVARLARLAEMLRSAGRQTNLTRLTEPVEFWGKHVADSLAIGRALPEVVEKTLRVADVGCGAGFPLLPLACAFPQWHLVGIESTGKKVEFVRRTGASLGLDNIEVWHGQAREAARHPDLRVSFDMVVARAVDTAGRLLRDCRHLLGAGRESRIVLYKTPGGTAEEQAELQRECGKFKFVRHVSPALRLPADLGIRQFLILRRQSQSLNHPPGG